MNNYISQLPQDTPYNNPPWEALDLSKIGKSYEGKPSPIAFTRGLYPELDSTGKIIRLKEQEIRDWDDIGEILVHEWGKHFSYVVYEPWELDVLLKTINSLPALTKLYEDGKLFLDRWAIWYSPGHKLTILERSSGKEARIQVIGNWSSRLGMYEACDRAGLSITEGIEPALKNLGDKILARIGQFQGKNFGDISSPTVLTRNILGRDANKVDVSSIPEEALKAYYEALHAPWVEMLAQGFFPNVYDYDLNSAYPTEIMDLVSCDSKAGEWIHKRDYVRQARYGVVTAIVDIREKEDTSPIRYRKSTGRLFSPYGTWIGRLTKSEVNWIWTRRLGKVQILDGWWFISKETYRPFLKTVQRLVDIRRLEKDEILRSIAKGISTRINGHFFQKYDTLDGEWIAGKMFNPVYAVEVMTRTKLKLADIARRTKTLSITVDGLVTPDPLPAQNLSNYKLVAQSPCVIAAPLVMHLNGREGRYRLLEALSKEGHKRHYKLGEKTRVGIRDALRMKRIELIGKEINSPVQLEVGRDTSRIWTDTPIRGKDLLEKQYFSKRPPIEYVEMGKNMRRNREVEELMEIK